MGLTVLFSITVSLAILTLLILIVEWSIRDARRRKSGPDEDSGRSWYE